MKAHLLIAFGLALGLMLLVLLAAPTPASQAAIDCQRFVAYEGDDADDCRSPEKPCATVQHAIDQSEEGDRICVASSLALLPDPTVYKELISIDRTVILDGKWESKCDLETGCSFAEVDPCDPARIELYAAGGGRVVTLGAKTAPTIDCFTITGGDAEGLVGDPEGYDAGGGIYGDYASPTILNNIIRDNYGCDYCTNAGTGGGIYLWHAGGDTLISRNLIIYNVAGNTTFGQGGGIMLRDSHGTIDDNQISYNRAGSGAGHGGGIAVVDGEPQIYRNVVSQNVAGQFLVGRGGGIFVWSGSTVLIEDNAIYSNRAISGLGEETSISAGGGIYYDGKETAVAAIVGNQIQYNTASPLAPQQGHGGGLYARAVVTPSLIAANVLEENIAGFNGDGSGGGIYLEASQATLLGNSIRQNVASWAGSVGQGGGLFVEDSMVTIGDNWVIQNAGGGFVGDPAATMGYGGGIVITVTVALVEDNIIVGNRATNSPAGVALGGGMYVYASTVRIAGNAIIANSIANGDYPVSAGFGGGLYVQESVPVLDGNTITDNNTDGATLGRGGGVRLVSCAPYTVTNNIIASNRATEYASGVGQAGGSGWIGYNTIADNTGGDGSGVYVADYLGVADATLYGNIIRGHTIGVAIEPESDSVPAADYTLFENNTLDHDLAVDSTNEIDPPALLLPDYHLSSGSNAIDKVPAVAWVARDIDGQRRPMWAASDAGADEYVVTLYLPLILRQ